VETVNNGRVLTIGMGGNGKSILTLPTKKGGRVVYCIWGVIRLGVVGVEPTKPNIKKRTIEQVG